MGRYRLSLFVYLFICLLIYFYCCSITLVCIFSPPLQPTPAKPTSIPCFHPPPWFCPCVLYSSSWKTFSPLSPPHSPLAIVRLFLTSMSLAIFCLLFSFVDYVPVKGEIIWYLSFWMQQLMRILASRILCCGSNRQIHVDYRHPVEKKGWHGHSLSERGWEG